MSADDIWVRREDGKPYRRVENDGWTFMRRPEARDDEIIGIGGYYKVILASGAIVSINYAGDWTMVLAHFTEEPHDPDAPWKR